MAILTSLDICMCVSRSNERVGSGLQSLNHHGLVRFWCDAFNPRFWRLGLVCCRVSRWLACCSGLLVKLFADVSCSVVRGGTYLWSVRARTSCLSYGLENERWGTRLVFRIVRSSVHSAIEVALLLSHVGWLGCHLFGGVPFVWDQRC
jgi:hypothetical protein